MTILRALLIFSAAAGLLASNAKASVTFGISPPTAQVGERVILEVTIPIADLPAGISADDEELSQITINDNLLSSTDKLILLGRDTLRTKNTWSWRWALTSYQPGKYRVPPVEIKIGSSTYSTESQEISILSTRAEEDLALRPEYGALNPPTPWALLFIGLALSLVAGFAAMWAVKRAKKIKLPHISIPVRPPPEENPLHWLKRQLAAFKEDFSKRGNESPNQQWVDRLGVILKEFYARALHAPAKAWTTKELETKGRKAPGLATLSTTLHEWDHHKFGKAEGSAAEITKSSLEKIERSLL